MKYDRIENYTIISTNNSDDGSHLVCLGQDICTRNGHQVVIGYSTRVNPEKSFVLSVLHEAFGSGPLSPNAITSLIDAVTSDSLGWHYGRELVPVDDIFSKKYIEHSDFLRLQRELRLYRLPRVP